MPRAVLDAAGGVEDEFSRGPQQVPYWGLCGFKFLMMGGGDLSEKSEIVGIMVSNVAATEILGNAIRSMRPSTTRSMFNGI